MKTAEPQRGQVWMANLDPAQGHEQAGRRPVLIVSADAMNSGPADLVIVLPVTSKGKGIPTHVPVQRPEGGLTMDSFVITEQIRCIAKTRLSQHVGEISVQKMRLIETVLRAILDLAP